MLCKYKVYIVKWLCFLYDIQNINKVISYKARRTLILLNNYLTNHVKSQFPRTDVDYVLLLFTQENVHRLCSVDLEFTSGKKNTFLIFHFYLDSVAFFCTIVNF